MISGPLRREPASTLLIRKQPVPPQTSCNSSHRHTTCHDPMIWRSGVGSSLITTWTLKSKLERWVGSSLWRSPLAAASWAEEEALFLASFLTISSITLLPLPSFLLGFVASQVREHERRRSRRRKGRRRRRRSGWAFLGLISGCISCSFFVGIGIDNRTWGILIWLERVMMGVSRWAQAFYWWAHSKSSYYLPFYYFFFYQNYHSFPHPFSSRLFLSFPCENSEQQKAQQREKKIEKKFLSKNSNFIPLYF